MSLGFRPLLCFYALHRNAFRSRFSIFLWIPLLYVTVLCAIFMVIPWKLEELFPVALTRLMMHTAPLLFLWICFELEIPGCYEEEWTQPRFAIPVNL